MILFVLYLRFLSPFILLCLALFLCYECCGKLNVRNRYFLIELVYLSMIMKCMLFAKRVMPLFPKLKWQHMNSLVPHQKKPVNR